MASWRPLFVPRTLDHKARTGQTTSSELPPPPGEPVALPAFASLRPAKIYGGPPVWTIALAATLFAGALVVLLRL